MNFKNTLFEPLFNRGKILLKQEISEIIAEHEKRFKSKKRKDFLKYLSRHNYIRRVLVSLYYVNSFDERNRGFCEFEDKEILFMALDKLGVKWYVGLSSALHLQGKGWQTPSQLSIVNTKFSGIKKVFGLRVKFFKTKEIHFFGLKEGRTKHNIRYLYSDPAKTYIDRVYFKEDDKLVKVKNTQKYLKRYPKWVGRR